MNKTTKAIIGIGILVIVSVGVIASGAFKNDSKMEKKGEVMEKKGEVMEKEVEGYTSYKPELLANADKSPVVLFFHAEWCPTCKALDKNIKENPEDFKKTGITLLKIDYDTATDLKKQYGVTSQSTFIQVDSSGKEIKKSGALVTVEALEKFVNKQ
jgi:thiol:disulfide interchange protein